MDCWKSVELCRILRYLGQPLTSWFGLKIMRNSCPVYFTLKKKEKERVSFSVCSQTCLLLRFQWVYDSLKLLFTTWSLQENSVQITEIWLFGHQSKRTYILDKEKKEVNVWSAIKKYKRVQIFPRARRLLYVAVPSNNRIISYFLCNYPPLHYRIKCHLH